MKIKLIKIIIGLCLVTFLLISGCTTENSNDTKDNGNEDNINDNTSEENFDNSNEESSEDIDTNVPIYPGAESQGYSEQDPLWKDYNVPTGMAKETFFINSGTITEVYDWYKHNLGDWEIRRPYFSQNPDNGEMVQIDVLLKNNDNGAYIILFDAANLPITATSILGVATGSWEITQNCGENDEFDPYGMGQGSIYFDTIPLDENDFYGINPLGSVSGGDHTFPTDHGAFHWNNPDSYPPLYNVVSPAYGIITEIRYTQYDWPAGSGQSGKYNDYRVRIEHTNNFWSFIGHISELDESILSQAGDLTVNGDTKFMDNPIFVEKGQIIGKTGGRPEAQTSLIWWIIDDDVTLNYVDPDRYNHFQHAVHFIERCQDDLASDLKQKIRSSEPYEYTRTANPVTGKVDFDESGKLVGNWFNENVNPNDPMADYQYHLSFVYDMWDPSKIVIGVGGTLDISATVYQAVESPTDPSDVALSSGQIIYKLTELEQFGSDTATILVELVEDEKIKVEGFSGHQSNPSFTGNAQYYIR